MFDYYRNILIKHTVHKYETGNNNDVNDIIAQVKVTR